MSRIARTVLAAVVAAAFTLPVAAQNAPAAPAAPAGSPAQAQPEKPHGFPPVKPENFDALRPSKETVEAFMHAQFGFDTNRTWQVQAIRKTVAPGYSNVVVLVSTRTSPDQISQVAFLVTPDEKFAIIGANPLPFGTDPFASDRAILRAEAKGPSRGAAKDDLLFVEFSDMQCPHCKAAAETMNKLSRDYPNAKFVYENYPLEGIHPWSRAAALWGVCVAQQSNDKFFTFLQAVFDEQEQVTDANVKEMMRNAAVKAGADAAKAEACAASPEAAAKVDASKALAEKLGVESTPTLFVNGRALPVSEQLSYETLQQIINFQAKLDGVTVAPQISGLGK